MVNYQPLKLTSFISNRSLGLNLRFLYLPFLAYSILLLGYLKLDLKYKLRGPWLSILDTSEPVCVITGGCGGLGHEIVKELLSRVKNLKIVIIDINEPDIKSLPQIDYLKCDLSNDVEVDNIISIIKERYPKINLLINNAAIRGRFSRLVSMPDKDIKHIFFVNVLSTVKLIQAFYPKDLNHYYYVVNIASALGIVSPARASTYAASKAALISYHESWSYELLNERVQNVRTLLVLPGQMDTSMFSGFEPPRQFLAPVVKSHELGKEIVDHCISGKRGEICKPFYVNFMRLLKCLPDMLVEQLRGFSKMDECLPLQN